MKKVFLVAMLSIFLFEFTFAQTVTVGPELGINIIPLGESNVGTNYQLGFHLGANVTYSYSNNWKISSGLFITQKKMSYSYSSTYPVAIHFTELINMGLVDSTQLFTFLNTPGVNDQAQQETRGVISEWFLEIPVMANYQYKNFNFLLGPYMGVLLAGKKKEEVRTIIPLFSAYDLSFLDPSGVSALFLPPADETIASEESTTENLRTVDFGLNTGLGYQVDALHFNLLYSFSFLDYRDEPGNSEKKALQTFRFSITYDFPFMGGKKPPVDTRFDGE